MPRNPNKIDYSQGFPEGFAAFEELEDTRTGGNTKHHFGEIIFMAYTCILCGVKSYELMEEFCWIRRKWFQKHLKLPHGTPSYGTFSRIMEALDPVIFSQCILTHLRLAGVEIADDQVAIDGKALRGSRSKTERHVHAVSAWACESGMTLAQAFVDEKSNEITAIPELLKMLNLKGAVITIDAMGTQREIVDVLVENGADYILCVKGNQGDLHKELIDQFAFAARQIGIEKLSSKNWSSHEEEKKNRGRLEKRQTVVCHYLDWMSSEVRANWQGLACIIMVIRHVQDSSGHWSSETNYYMSSLEKVEAAKIQKYIRSHWRIENSCHWVLDTLFREDHNQTGKRNAAKNLSTLRRIALNALKRASDHTTRKRSSSLTKKQLRAAHDEDYLEEILFSLA